MALKREIGLWQGTALNIIDMVGIGPFLREAYGPARWGRLVSFLFLFQIIFSAPLSMASGAIGFSRYLHFVFPEIPDRWEAPVASLLCVAVTLLLMRRIGAIGKFSVVLWIGGLATLGAVIGLGLPDRKSV